MPSRDRPTNPAAGPGTGPDDSIDKPGSPAFKRNPDVISSSSLDRTLSRYRNEPRLRQMVGVLAFPALAALTGIGLLLDPGPATWLMAVLALLAGAEGVSASLVLRRQREAARDTGSPRL
jgi:hypothetical protein